MRLRGNKGIITVSKDFSNITVAFRYNAEFVEKIKTIPDHRWNPKEKHWSFPDTDGTLEKILNAFDVSIIWLGTLGDDVIVYRDGLTILPKI